MRKIFLWSLLGIGVLVLAVYTALWFWMAGYVRAQFDQYLKEAREKNITVTTRTIGVYGYPFKHEVRFSGRLAVENVLLEIPALWVESLFMPGKPIRIEAPEGLTIVEPAQAVIWSLDSLLIESIIPAYLPGSLTREDLAAWKQAGGNLTLDSFEFTKRDLAVKGRGNLALDNELQPTGALNARITGHLEFLTWLQQNGYVDTREGLLAAAVLRGLSQMSEEEGTYMNVVLTLQNRTLFVGPLRLATLPKIVWGWRSQPVQLQ